MPSVRVRRTKRGKKSPTLTKQIHADSPRQAKPTISAAQISFNRRRATGLTKDPDERV